MFKPHMGLILDHSIIILMELAIHSREILNEYSSNLHTGNSYYLLYRNFSSEQLLPKYTWNNNTEATSKYFILFVFYMFLRYGSY